ncbi:hypothetical protein [Acidithiobacillus sp.]
MHTDAQDTPAVANIALDTPSSLAVTTAVARQLAEYLEFGGEPVRAGKDIQSFADQHGDAAVSALIDELTNIDLSNVLRHYDLTSTSPIQMVISPERFAALVEMEHKYASGDYAELRGMLSGVLFAESSEPSDERAIECLEAIVWQPHALELLAGMLMKHAETEIINFWLYGSFRVTATDPDNDTWLEDCLNGHVPLDIGTVRSRAAQSTGDFSDIDLDDPPLNTAADEVDTRSGMADGDLQQLCWLLREYHEEFFMDMILQILRSLMAQVHARNGGG